jgi:hypothetical protein
MIEGMALRNLLLLAAGSVLLVGCGSSSGSSSDASAVYGHHATASASSGAAASSGGAARSRSGAASSTARNAGAHPVQPSLTTGFGTTGATGGQAGGSTGTTGGGHHSNCTQSTSSGAHITVCPGRNLADGMQVTVTGDHFHPTYQGKPEGLLVMQCDYKGEAASDYGPNDCNINVLNLAANSTQANPDGTVSAYQLTVRTKFKKIDCTKQQCMVTVAQPIQSGSADNPHALIYFG